MNEQTNQPTSNKMNEQINERAFTPRKLWNSLLSRDVTSVNLCRWWSKANDKVNYYFKIFTCT